MKHSTQSKKYKGTILSNTGVHIPTFCEHDNADIAVIFVHGLMGSPTQFDDLARAVYDVGCTFSCILLPGHGSGVMEFAKFGAADWQRHLQQEIDKIKNAYDRIFLVGHSMGGLLSLNASLKKENKISGVFLIATPLKVHLYSPTAFLKKIRLLTFPKSNPAKAAYMKSNSIELSKPLIALLAIKTFRDFFKLMKQTKKRLPDVTVPVYMFHSKVDETVSYKSAEMLYKTLCNTQIMSFTFDKSWHNFYDKNEREIIKSKLIEAVK